MVASSWIITGFVVSFIILVVYIVNLRGAVAMNTLDNTKLWFMVKELQDDIHLHYNHEYEDGHRLYLGKDLGESGHYSAVKINQMVKMLFDYLKLKPYYASPSPYYKAVSIDQCAINTMCEELDIAKEGEFDENKRG